MGIVADDEISEISDSFGEEDELDSQESSTYSGNVKDVDVEDLYESDLAQMDLQDNLNLARATSGSFKDNDAPFLSKDLVIPMKKKDRRAIMKSKDCPASPLKKQSTRTAATENSMSSQSESKQSIRTLSTNSLQAHALNFSSRSMRSLDIAPTMPRKSVDGRSDSKIQLSALEVQRCFSDALNDSKKSLHDSRKSLSLQQDLNVSKTSLHSHKNSLGGSQRSLSRTDSKAQLHLEEAQLYFTQSKSELLDDEEEELLARPKVVPSKEKSFTNRSQDTPLAKPMRSKSFESKDEIDNDTDEQTMNDLPILAVKINMVRRKDKKKPSTTPQKTATSTQKASRSKPPISPPSKSKSKVNIAVPAPSLVAPEKIKTSVELATAAQKKKIEVTRIPCKEVKDPVKKVYAWYTRLGQPNKRKFKARIASMSDIDITEDDVDLLPWILNGSTVNVARVNAHLLKILNE